MTFPPRNKGHSDTLFPRHLE